MKRSYEIDMVHGLLLGKMLIFAVPPMLSGVLQLLFNAEDIIVVGRFSGSQALAAVGFTGTLINLLVNVFMGLSIGANVLTVRYVGAKDEKELSDTVHTAVLFSLISGVLLIFLGLLLASLLGDSAKLVQSRLNHVPGCEVDLFGTAVMENADGICAQISFGMDNAYQCQLEVWGSKITLIASRVFTAGADVPPSLILRSSQDEKTIALEKDDQFLHSIEWFGKAVAGGSAAPVAFRLMGEDTGIIHFSGKLLYIKIAPLQWAGTGL